MKKLALMLIVTTVLLGTVAARIDTTTFRAGDLIIQRDKGYIFLDNEPIHGYEQYFKPFHD